MTVLPRMDAVYLFMKRFKLNEKASESVWNSNSAEHRSNHSEFRANFVKARVKAYIAPFRLRLLISIVGVILRKIKKSKFFQKLISGSMRGIKHIFIGIKTNLPFC